GWLAGSSFLPDQTDKNVFERALSRLKVPEADAAAVEVLQQRRDAGALALRVVGIDKVHTTGAQRQTVCSQIIRDCFKPLLQVQDQLLPAELAHQGRLLLD